MYRRRRPAREPIHFSFDSFLDVVANVIGIVVRLILVAWVGARSYSAAMERAAKSADPLPEWTASRAADDPLHGELDATRRDLEDARRRLFDQIGRLQLAEQESVQARVRVEEATNARQAVEKKVSQVGAYLAGKRAQEQQAIASADELKRRGEELLRQVKALEAAPPQKQVLRYHAPISRAVHADEVFFECRGDRVAYIDLPTFMQEIRAGLDDKAPALKSQWEVTATTAPAGPFRLRYTVAREKNALEGLGGGPVAGNFRYGVTEWVLEPITELRGEPLEIALTEQSEFRRLAERIDPQITVVTFWVYPDSFALFRRLRDVLYERGIEVAGRPLPIGAPIAGSRQGTASRGQ
jgi:hypothetical protein